MNDFEDELRSRLAARASAVSVQSDWADLTVAAQEACTNAIQHAYGPGSAEFVLYARHVGDEVIIGVHDQGGWRTQRGSNRGRGMPVMRSFTDAVEVQSDSTGTNVELRRRLQGGG